jgi:simple sugar transport system ATP-binding protein
VVVLRAGRVVDAAPTAERSEGDLVRAMVGADIPAGPAKAGAPGGILLAVRDLAARRDNGAVAFSSVSFELRAGEILALAGVEGNGQQELAEVLAGLRAAVQGTCHFLGRPLGNDARTRRRRAHGIRHVPHDRLRNGVLPRRSLTDNFLLSHWFDRAFGRRGWLRRRHAAAATAELTRAFDVRGAKARPLGGLSGGNQQKLVVARELWGSAQMLIASHPTRGLDVRTVAALQQTLVRRRNEGLGILLTSSDLAEIWQIADRVMVLARGRLRGPVPVGETSLQEVGTWISGG